MADRTVRVAITGHVQGVGYRAWVEREARRRGLKGWVRNRKDGSVEAVFSGEAEAVEAMTVACKVGPRSAVVLQTATSPMLVPPDSGFRVLPTE
ncbi:MAG: acylphosphatase [Bauldia sp.]